MATEVHTFTEFQQKMNDGEKTALRLEVEKLRRAEGEWLQVLARILDHIFALHNAAQSGKPEVTEQIAQFQNACRDVARRVGLVQLSPSRAPVQRRQTQGHQRRRGAARRSDRRRNRRTRSNVSGPVAASGRRAPARTSAPVEETAPEPEPENKSGKPAFARHGGKIFPARVFAQREKHGASRRVSVSCRRMTRTEKLLAELIALPSVNPAFLPAAPCRNRRRKARRGFSRRHRRARRTGN